MSFTRAAGLGCLLLLSPALCFSAYADEDAFSSDTDPYLKKGETSDGTMTASGQTLANAVPASSDKKPYNNIYGATAQAKDPTSYGDILDIHTTDASNNNITFNGFLKSGFLFGAMSVPSAYDSTGNAKATADYNTIQISGADNFVSIGANALAYEIDSRNSDDASSDTDNQVAYTVSLSASHNTFDITGGSQKVAAGGLVLIGANGDTTITSAAADYNTLTLHGGTYNFNKTITADAGDEDEDEGTAASLPMYYPIGISAGSVLLLEGDYKLGTLSASNNTLVLAADSDGKAPEFIGNIVLHGGSIVGETSAVTSYDTTKNTLVTDNVKGMTAYNVADFSNYEFRLPDMKANETVLTLTDPEGTALKGGTLASEGSATEDTLSVKVTKVGNLYGSDGGVFKNGDKVYLVKNENGLTVTDGYTTSVTGQTGVSVNYEMEIAKDENSLYLIRTGGTSSVNSGTKAIAEGAAAGSALINAGSDAVIAAISSMTSFMNNAQSGASASSSPASSATVSFAPGTASSASGASSNGAYSSGDASSYGGASASSASSGKGTTGSNASGKNPSGMDSANKDASGRDGSDDGNGRGRARNDGSAYGNIFAFGYAQGSSVRHETGSSVNVSAVSLVAGLGKGFETGAGNLAVGAFFEYGKGSYTTNNSFDDRSDIDGDGNAWYMGGGIMARMDFVPTGPGHFYAEGSAHLGTLHNEYDSNDLTDTNGRVAKFDMDSPYYSLHGGLGYVWNFAEGHDLDLYGKYIWSRVQGTDDSLTTKDKFDYDDMDSNRIRLGVRYSYAGNARFSPYIGAAFEHEFSGSCDSRAYGHPVASPSFEGSSGMGELGLVMRPTVSVPLSLNLGVQGYVGQKQGVSGNCTVMYEF